MNTFADQTLTRIRLNDKEGTDRIIRASFDACKMNKNCIRAYIVETLLKILYTQKLSEANIFLTHNAIEKALDIIPIRNAMGNQSVKLFKEYATLLTKTE